MGSRQEWLAAAEARLRDAGIESARLDSELLLTHALNISRARLHAHPETPIPEPLGDVLEATLSLRIIRVPLAYIVGHREFYGRLFKVTPSVLIPRPETEDIVTIVTELPPFKTILDIGTGSGALAITLALAFPQATVVATDSSQQALSVARANSETYQTAITFIKADLLGGFESPTHPLCVVANLPYVALSDERSPETHYEPEEALFAADDGLHLIKRLIDQAAPLFAPGDFLLLESNPSQQPAIAAYAHEKGFALERTLHLVSVLRRDEP